jgi:hypothetical protein
MCVHTYYIDIMIILVVENPQLQKKSRQGLYSEVGAVDMSANDGDANQPVKARKATLIPEKRRGMAK